MMQTYPLIIPKSRLEQVSKICRGLLVIYKTNCVVKGFLVTSSLINQFYEEFACQTQISSSRRCSELEGVTWSWLLPALRLKGAVMLLPPSLAEVSWLSSSISPESLSKEGTRLAFHGAAGDKAVTSWSCCLDSQGLLCSTSPSAPG